MIKSAGAWLYRWVLVFGLIKSFCGAKEDPPSAVGGLGRLMWVGLMCWLFVGGLMCCLFVGGAWKIFCLYILKAHGLRSMGLLCCGVFIKRPTQRSGWAWKMGLLFLILIEKYRNLLSISSSIMLLIN